MEIQQDTKSCKLCRDIEKRKYNSKPTLHKIIRDYERYELTASEMIGRIMLLEGLSDEDL